MARLARVMALVAAERVQALRAERRRGFGGTARLLDRRADRAHLEARVLGERRLAAHRLRGPPGPFTRSNQSSMRGPLVP